MYGWIDIYIAFCPSRIYHTYIYLVDILPRERDPRAQKPRGPTGLLDIQSRCPHFFGQPRRGKEMLLFFAYPTPGSFQKAARLPRLEEYISCTRYPTAVYGLRTEDSIK